MQVIKNLLLTCVATVNRNSFATPVLIIKAIRNGLFMFLNTTIQPRLSFDVKFCHLTFARGLLTHTAPTRQQRTLEVHQPIATTKVHQLAQSQ